VELFQGEISPLITMVMLSNGSCFTSSALLSSISDTFFQGADAGAVEGSKEVPSR
jgi:hypothetical protein